VYADPYGDDPQLALYRCCELHYRGFAGVDPEWEWEPGRLRLRLRAEMEHRFLPALRADGGSPRRAEDALADLLVEPAAPKVPPNSSKKKGSCGTSVSTRPNAPSAT
jgi:hypothetical protein